MQTQDDRRTCGTWKVKAPRRCRTCGKQKVNEVRVYSNLVEPKDIFWSAEKSRGQGNLGPRRLDIKKEREKKGRNKGDKIKEEENVPGHPKSTKSAIQKRFHTRIAAHTSREKEELAGRWCKGGWTLSWGKELLSGRDKSGEHEEKKRILPPKRVGGMSTRR